MSADHGVVQPEEKKKNKKRAIIIVAGILAASGVGSLAFAYWTQSGGGADVAGTDTTASLSVSQDAVGTALYPGASVPLTGSITNPNSSAIRLNGLTGVVSVPTGSSCNAGWYSVTGTPSFSNNDVAGGGSVTWSGLTLAMSNPDVNQNACKGVQVTVTYVSS